MNNNIQDFKATVSIIGVSPSTDSMQTDLPSNYSRSQDTNVFSLLYGSGVEQDLLKQSFLQIEANNYLSAPDIQTGDFAINGANHYLIEFEIPFTIPPLDVSISGITGTDVYIEYTSRFGMVINVLTDAPDTLQWRASGTVGAVNDQYIGDALYLNFGTLYQFPRVGEALIDDTYVSFYEKTNKFIYVSNLIAVENVSVNFDSGGNVVGSPIITKNFPPLQSTPIKGIIQPTKAISSPHATHQLVDLNGSLIALLDCSAITLTNPVSAYYADSNNNLYKDDARTYVLGYTTTCQYDRWQQPSFIQEVFRADSVYRRLLLAINKALFLGPTLAGISKLTEALIAQPNIPADYWEQSDYRVYANSIGQNQPRYLTYTKDASGNITAVNSATQQEGYPSLPPTVEVRRITQDWDDTRITYNTKPSTVSLESPISQQITTLNHATRFDISNELIRQLRLGIDIQEGGIVNWNYGIQSAGISGTLPSTGFPLYETYNYFFLNNQADNITNINLFWYAQQTNGLGPIGYRAFGPLRFGRDFFAFPTANFLLSDGTYDLPSELLVGYNANASVPYYNSQADVFGNLTWQGQNLVSAGTIPNTLKTLPSIIIQLDLRKQSLNNNNISTKMPTNIDDFIMYSYGSVSTTQSVIEGNFLTGLTSDNQLVPLYYDADTSSAYQPADSPFATSQSGLPPTALAQSSFAKFVTNTGYEYTLTMLGGTASFNKTVFAENIKRQTPFNPNIDQSPPGILILQAITSTAGSNPNQQVGTQQFVLSGTIARMTDSLGIRYFEADFGNFVILDTNGNPIGIIAHDSFVQFNNLVGTVQSVYGNVEHTIWDTRIPVATYRTTAPIFQASNNFNAELETYTPDTSIAQYHNENFLVIITGLPLGNQQTITATWDFQIRPTLNSGSYDSGALAFSDRDINNVRQFGIMSTFMGINLLQNNLDPDDATYNQTYISPSFNGYFINYKDYINDIGSSLTSYGDANSFDTLTNPVLKKPAIGQPSGNTVLNFFNPGFGFISVSILPNESFYNTGNATQVPITRPNNKGLALQIQGDSYAGLVFYGTSGDTNIDKPLRLVADFTYSSANSTARKKTLQLGDSGQANFVDASHPDDVQTGSTFYLAGNSYKYCSDGFDQSVNQYTSNEHQTAVIPGSYYDRFPFANALGITPPPVFFTDPGQNVVETLSDGVGVAGQPMRYRRSQADASMGIPATTTALQTGYYNTSPEKIAYLQFDLSALPLDTIVNNAFLEVYFCSGFTVKQAKDVNFSLNKNSAWNRSRLSGNGRTFVKQLQDNQGNKYSILSPLQNTHWRKNFFEVIIPYAFLSEDNGANYGIRSLFAPQNSGILPQPLQPQPNLEIFGFVNINEIDTLSLTDYTNFIESSVGLSNIILSASSSVYKINGILHFNENSDGTTSIANCFDTINGIIYANLTNCPTLISDPTSPSTQTILGMQISPNNILPNDKIIIFPFGINNSSIYYYGVVTSTLPPQYVGFDNNSNQIINQVLSYCVPAYSEYNVNLLNADTYMSYKNFGRNNQVVNTIEDISY